LADLLLRHNGNVEPLPRGATLTSPDSRTWTLALPSATLRPAIYEVSLPARTASIADAAGNPLPAGTYAQWIAQPTADLTVAKTDSANQVRVGRTFQYQITVTNNGPERAKKVDLTGDRVDYASVSRDQFNAQPLTVRVQRHPARQLAPDGNHFGVHRSNDSSKMTGQESLCAVPCLLRWE